MDDSATASGGETQFWLPNLFHLLPSLRGGVTTRRGGVSAPPFRSLNLGLHVGDEAANVVENRRRAAEILGFSLDTMVCAAQIHGGAAAVVGETEKGRGARHFADALPGVDALVTDTRGVLCALFFADCLPILLADPMRGAIGVAHAGWRGLAAGIIPNTVSAMETQFGTRPNDLIAAVGPGIGSCCFEVGPEVAAYFPQETRLEAGKIFVSLTQAAERALQQAGVRAERLSVYGGCTSCEPEHWFSHRRDAGRTGRMGALLGLAPQG